MCIYVHIYMCMCFCFLLCLFLCYLIMQEWLQGFSLQWVDTYACSAVSRFFHSGMLILLLCYCCCWIPWVFLCWPLTIYWSPLRKLHPDLRQRNLMQSKYLECFVLMLEGAFFLFLFCVHHASVIHHLLRGTFLDMRDSTTTIIDIGSLPFFIVIAVASYTAKRHSQQPP